MLNRQVEGALKKNTILITGGAGFIGTNLIEYIIKNEIYEVVNLDKLTYAHTLESLDSLPAVGRHSFVKGDICDRGLLVRVLDAHRPFAIIHLAAESSVDKSIIDPEIFIKSNISGTFCLLDAVREYWRRLSFEEQKAFRFLHVSTDEVYGSAEKEAFTEKCRYKPNSPYSASKAASDHLVRAYNKTYGLPVLVSHSANNYGPRQFPEKLIPVVVISALSGKPIPVYGLGQNVREWLYVDDHCRALLTILLEGAPGEAYNIGSGCEKKNINVVNDICDILDDISPRADNKSYREQIVFVKDRAGHDLRYAVNAEKICRDLKWRPETAYDAGLRKTVEWYRDNIEWCNHRKKSESSCSKPELEQIVGERGSF
jgi:dTDP-glucose 4,6-dehydratase